MALNILGSITYLLLGKSIVPLCINILFNGQRIDNITLCLYAIPWISISIHHGVYLGKEESLCTTQLSWSIILQCTSFAMGTVMFLTLTRWSITNG